MGLKEKAKKIKENITRVYLSVKLKETPWYAKAVGGIAIVYALSPIDLIPDFIPVFGYLDDLIILPLLILLTIKLIPKEVWERTEEEAKNMWQNGKPKKLYYAIPFILIWIIVLVFIIIKIFKLY